MRVVVISHGHPRFGKGGGEIAAYNLYRGLDALPGVDAWFIARAPQKLLHLGTPLAMVAPREYLIAGEASEEQLVATVELGPDHDVARLLRQINPDVVHFHHYYKLGVELLRVARNACPNAKLLLTLHEYMAICLNHGTMVKTDGRLCYRYEPRECLNCLPELDDADVFFLREQYLKSFFKLVDRFVAPSNFLAQRYQDWGLPAPCITVLENGIVAGQRLPPRPLAAGESRSRLAFFGQMHPFKGLDLIIESLAGLPKALRRQLSLDVYGHGLELMQGEYPKRLKQLLEDHTDFVHYHGSYDQEELPRLMAETDWVVLGSTWWENSPLVIQEAYKFGRPVLCPDLGGMAEKVPDGQGGLHYRARDPISLRRLVQRLLQERTPTLNPGDPQDSHLPAEDTHSTKGTPAFQKTKRDTHSKGDTHPPQGTPTPQHGTPTFDQLIARLPDYTTVEAAAAAHHALYRSLGGSRPAPVARASRRR
ncbi:MAG TPA: glycosyltransferase [Hyphomicrobiales bacterium]|nr:glycosyltransferase [Hyphomicrobiales bacterium]